MKLVPCLVLGAAAALCATLPAFAAAPVVRGTVLAPSGAPLAGARADLVAVPAAFEQGRLRIAGEEPRPAASSVTDALGRYSLAATGPGVFAVRISAPGSVPLQSMPLPLVDDFELPAAAPQPDAGASLVLRGPDGAARAGLRVYAEGEPARSLWAAAPRVGRSAADGSLVLPRLQDERLTLHVFSADGAEEVRTGVAGGPVALGGAAAEVRRLRVVDPRGAPVAGVLVRRGDAAWPVGFTGADGTLAIAAAGQESPRLLLMTADGRQQSARLGSDPGTVVLSDPAVVSGRVTQAETGRPAAGALVWSGSDPGLFQVADADGRYRVAAPGALWLEARAAGRLPRRATLTAAQIGAGRAPTLALERAAVLAGRVVDAAGRGVAGAWVSAALEAVPGAPRQDGPVAGSSSGADGAFSLGLLRAAELYTVQAVRPGFLPARVKAVTGSRARKAAPVALVLLAARQVVGRVQGADRQPVAGAEIRLRPAASAEDRERQARLRAASPDSPPQAVSDAAGRFTVAEAPGLDLDVAVARTGFAPLELRGVKLAPGTGPADLGALTLTPGARVAGQVVDGRGRPVAGASVFRLLQAGQPGELAEGLRDRKPDAATGADGRFALADLSPGLPVHLLVTARGYLPEIRRGVQPPTAKPVVVRLQAGVSLAGRVIDEAGRPVPGAEVELVWAPSVPGHERLQAGAAVSRHATADRDGRFEIPDLPLDRVTLAVDAPGFAPSRGVEAALPLPKGEELTVRLERGATLEGRVSTSAGEPVSGVRILVGPAAGVSDDDGVYRVDGVQPGPRVVEARHPAYETLRRPVSLDAGANHLDLVLPAGQEVRGRVVDPAGEPMPGAMVQLGSEAPRDPRWYRARADADGAFTLAPVGRGTFRLRASADGYADGEIDGVEVGAEAVDGLVVTLQAAGRIHGRILGLQPAELPGVEVRASDGSGDERLAEVDAAGGYALAGLAPGDWRLEATVEDGRRAAQARVPLPPGGDAVRDLEFQGLSLAGEVLFDDRPLDETQVSLRGQRWSVERTVTTDYDGRFRFEDLEPDTYWLTLTNDRDLLVHNQLVEVAADREVTIRLEASDVTGVVTDAGSRKPLGQAMVTLRHVASGDRPEYLVAAGTEDDGGFILPHVPPGRYRLTATRDGYSTVERDLDVPGGRDLSGVEVPLQPSPGIDLAVRLASGRVPSVLNLRLLSPSGEVVLADSQPLDREGHVRLSTVPPGAWTLLASSTAGALTSGSLTVPGDPVALTLPDASRLAVRVNPLASSDAVGTVRLLGPDGRALRTLSLGGRLEESWTMIGGKVLVDGVPAGAWVVQVSTADGRAWTGAVSTDGIDDAALTLD